MPASLGSILDNQDAVVTRCLPYKSLWPGLHKGPPVDTPQLAGGRKVEIRRRRIKLLVWDK